MEHLSTSGSCLATPVVFSVHPERPDRRRRRIGAPMNRETEFVIPANETVDFLNMIFATLLPWRLKPRLQTAPSPPARAPRPREGQSAQADFVLFVGANSFAGQWGVYRHSRTRESMHVVSPAAPPGFPLSRERRICALRTVGESTFMGRRRAARFRRMAPLLTAVYPVVCLRARR